MSAHSFIMSSQSVKTGSNVRSITYHVLLINEFRVITYELLASRRELRTIGELLSNPIEVLPIVHGFLPRPHEFRALNELLSSRIEVPPRPSKFRAIKVITLGY
jgi:hypothetical protein